MHRTRREWARDFFTWKKLVTGVGGALVLVFVAGMRAESFLAHDDQIRQQVRESATRTEGLTRFVRDTLHPRIEDIEGQHETIARQLAELGEINSKIDRLQDNQRRMLCFVTRSNSDCRPD